MDDDDRALHERFASGLIWGLFAHNVIQARRAFLAARRQRHELRERQRAQAEASAKANATSREAEAPPKRDSGSADDFSLFDDVMFKGNAEARLSEENRGWDYAFVKMVEYRDGRDNLTPKNDTWYYNRVYGMLLNELIDTAKEGYPLTQLNLGKVFSDNFMYHAVANNYAQFFGGHADLDPKKVVAAVKRMQRDYQKNLYGNRRIITNFMSYWYDKMQRDFASGNATGLSQPSETMEPGFNSAAAASLQTHVGTRSDEGLRQVAVTTSQLTAAEGDPMAAVAEERVASSSSPDEQSRGGGSSSRVISGSERGAGEDALWVFGDGLVSRLAEKNRGWDAALAYLVEDQVSMLESASRVWASRPVSCDGLCRCGST